MTFDPNTSTRRAKSFPESPEREKKPLEKFQPHCKIKHNAHFKIKQTVSSSNAQLIVFLCFLIILVGLKIHSLKNE